MANLDFPAGFVPVRPEYGAAPKVEEFTVADTTLIYQYQPVIVNSDGLIAAATHHNLQDGQGIGVAAHTVSSAASDRTILVYTDPEQEYEMQVDDATLTGAGEAIGRLFRITGIGSGNATTLQSIAEIDGSSGVSITGTTNDGTDTAPIRIERVSRQGGNTPYAIHGRFVVRFCGFAMLRSNAGVGGDDGVLHMGT